MGFFKRASSSASKPAAPPRPKVPEAIAALLRSLDHFDREGKAINALRKVGAPAVEPLYDKILHSESNGEAIKALGYIAWDHPDAVLAHLPKLLATADSDKRNECRNLVGKLISFSAEQNPQRGVRTLRLVLAAVGHPSAEIQKYWSDELFSASQRAFPDSPMGSPTGDRSRPPDEDYRVALEGVRAEAVARYLPLMRSPDADLRLRAVQILGFMDNGTPAVLDALKAAFKDPDEKVRWNAAKMLPFIQKRIPTAEAEHGLKYKYSGRFNGRTEIGEVTAGNEKKAFLKLTAFGIDVEKITLMDGRPAGPASAGDLLKALLGPATSQSTPNPEDHWKSRMSAMETLFREDPAAFRSDADLMSALKNAAASGFPAIAARAARLK